jgi:hypothetical protein
MLNLLAFSFDYHSVVYHENGATMQVDLAGNGICLTFENAQVKVHQNVPSPVHPELRSLKLELGHGQLLIALDQSNGQFSLIQPLTLEPGFAQSNSFTGRPPIRMGSLDTIGGREMLLYTGDLRASNGETISVTAQSTSKTALCLFLNLLAFSLYIRREGNNLIFETIPNEGLSA